VLYDPLGRVIATSVHGQIGSQQTGDLPLGEYEVKQGATFDDVIANPATYLQSATAYFFYDLFAWADRQQPVNDIGITRTMHVQELLAGGKTADDAQMPVAVTYSDGHGSTLQTKTQTGTQARWIVSGYTVYNNKGLPVEQYLPYFSTTADFEDQQAVISEKLLPPPAIIHYDPAGRVIRTTKRLFRSNYLQPMGNHCIRL